MVVVVVMVATWKYISCRPHIWRFYWQLAQNAKSCSWHPVTNPAASCGMWRSIPALDAKERILLRIPKHTDASNHIGKCVPTVTQKFYCRCQSGNNPRSSPWTALSDWPLSVHKPRVYPKVVYPAAVLAELCVSECFLVGSYAGYSGIQTELLSGFTLDQQRPAYEIL